MLLQKAQMRRELLTRREALSVDEVERKSALIQDRFLDRGFLEGVSALALYAPFKNEVRMDRIFEEARCLGIELYFPRVDQKDRSLSFCKVKNWKELVEGSWGILEPSGNEKKDIRECDLVLVPGLAFDEKGYRLGFGKGFYDQSLRGGRATKIALAYDFQIIPHLPIETHDLRCDFVVTERRTYDCS